MAGVGIAAVYSETSAKIPTEWAMIVCRNPQPDYLNSATYA